MSDIQKSPRLIRRGDVVKLKHGDGEDVVRGVVVVLQLANGGQDTYSLDELVQMGTDNDLSPADLAAAALQDAADRAIAVRADAEVIQQIAEQSAIAEAAALESKTQIDRLVEETRTRSETLHEAMKAQPPRKMADQRSDGKVDD